MRFYAKNWMYQPKHPSHPQPILGSRLGSITWRFSNTTGNGTLGRTVKGPPPCHHGGEAATGAVAGSIIVIVR